MDVRTDVRFQIGRNVIVGILSGIKNKVLDWSLQLEQQGIQGGTDLSFSKSEQEIAKDLGTTYKIDIENFNGNIGTVSDHAIINAKQINGLSQKSLMELIQQIEKYTPDLALGNEAAAELSGKIGELRGESTSEKMQVSKVKMLLVSVQNILTGAAGNIVADGIIFAIQKMVST